MSARRRKASLEEAVGLGRLRFFGAEDEHAHGGELAHASVAEHGQVERHEHGPEHVPEHEHVHVSTTEPSPLPAPPARAVEARSVHLHALLTPTASRRLRELAEAWEVSQGEVLRFAIDLTWRLYRQGGGRPRP
ncbi:MAG: hypothetical protein AB1816_00195 [Bacillota bacterium]